MAQGNFRKLGAKSVPNLLDKINRVEIVDNVTAGGSGVPLSAEQGKSLKGLISTEVSDRTNGDLAIIAGATASYNNLEKIEGVIVANKAAAELAINDLRNEVSGSVATQIAALEAEDIVINARIDSEESARTTAVTNEENARIAAVSAVDAKIVQEVADRTSAISAVDVAYKAADAILQTNIDTAKTAVELLISTEVAARQADVATLDGKIGTEKTERIADIANVTSLITTETSNRVSAVNAIDSRMSAVETGMATGSKFKGSVADLAAFEAIPEAGQEAGWMYVVGAGSTGNRDVYVVVADQSGDHKPSAWSTKSLVWLMDYADVTNVVTTERTQRVAQDTQLQNNINTLEGTVTSNKSVIEAAIATLRTDMQNADAAAATATANADAALQAGLDAEISNRETAVTAVQTNLTAEVAAREAAITAEADARTVAVNGVQANVDAEKAAREAAIAAEATARHVTDTAIQDALAQEILDRQAAIAALGAGSGDLISGLDARLDIIEGDSTVSGSVAKALLDAKKYADLYIPMPVIEGHDGTLLVVGDTVTLSSNVWRGLSGVLMGEVIVYQADGDAVMVSVGNVSGNVITLKVGTAGEYNGCEVKVHYLIIEADQTGSGMGFAGSGGAGI